MSCPYYWYNYHYACRKTGKDVNEDISIRATTPVDAISRPLVWKQRACPIIATN